MAVQHSEPHAPKRRPAFRLLRGWQRFPSAFVAAGWLRQDHASRVPHSALSTLLGIYGQLFEQNLKGDPLMMGGSVELDLPLLSTTAGLADDAVHKWLRLLQRRRLVSVTEAGTARVLDPLTRRWPPIPFAMVPIRHVLNSLSALRGASRDAGVLSRDALSLYLAMAAQRNRLSEEIWFSKERTAWIAGLESKVAVKGLAALMAAGLVVRAPKMTTWTYLLCGFEVGA